MPQKLLKSARRYLAMLLTFPYSESMSRSPNYRRTLAYYNALIDEFGHKQVREAIEQCRS